MQGGYIGFGSMETEQTNEVARLREPDAEESKVLDKVLEELIEEDRHYAPEWRELGPDEVIQEGDEVMDIQGNWNQAIISIGRTPRNRCTKARRRS